MKMQRCITFVCLLGLVWLVTFEPAGTRAVMAQEPLPTPGPTGGGEPEPGSTQESLKSAELYLLSTSRGEVLTVPFQAGTDGVYTSQSYDGLVSITVAGVGQASGTEYSDAFYIYTDDSGNPIPPFHPTEFYNWTLWINGGPADYFVAPIPSYDDGHVYSFKIDAPGGPLVFAVGDTWTDDNTGAYTVEIVRKAQKGSWWNGVIGALTGVAKQLDLDVGELIAQIKGLGEAWETLVAGWQIYRVSELGEQFGDPDYRARLIDEAYNNYDGKNVRFRSRVDGGVAFGCTAVGCTAESWNELSFEQKRNDEIWSSVCKSVGGGYCSGYLRPAFAKRWLE